LETSQQDYNLCSGVVPTDSCRESFKASTNQWQLILISVEIAAVCPNSNWRVLLETSWHGVEALHIIPFEVPEVAAAFLLIRHAIQ
jgi:hypothetical protein